ncbi:MAG: hypothetical protein EBX47_07930, partial [Synechococcaceae bacterium WB8_1B_057]|nr:hypothetical protein [Synechococcaceae bacterium WB8_1B_057]
MQLIQKFSPKLQPGGSVFQPLLLPVLATHWLWHGKTKTITPVALVTANVFPAVAPCLPAIGEK